MPSRTAAFSLLSALLLAGGPALAQGSPSADSIINSLRPGAGLSGGTRGIRPVGPSESAAPASPGTHTALPRAGTPAASPGTRPAAPTTAAQSAPSVNLTVQFANNSAELTPAATRTLDELGRALSSQALSSYRFRIEGHTDTVGSREHNQELSEQRARAVVEYLASKFGVDRSRVEAVGMGEDHPLVPTRANVSEPRNRRVTVINLGT
jgi:OmpA-OmpF porin, OOP family